MEYYDLHAGSAAGFWMRFVLATLATWRISHLLVAEDGPWEVFARIRRRFDSSAMGGLMDCFGCVSIWVAAPLSLFVSRVLPDIFFCWLALSGAAFLLELMHPAPLVIEPLSQSNSETAKDDTSYGMLR
jgi:hypothetical protein